MHEPERRRLSWIVLGPICLLLMGAAYVLSSGPLHAKGATHLIEQFVDPATGATRFRAVERRNLIYLAYFPLHYVRGEELPGCGALEWYWSLFE